jgi:hypothetical protein
VEPWVRALQGTQFAATDRVELVTVFNYIEFCLTQIVQDNELGALREVGGAGLAGLAWRLLRLVGGGSGRSLGGAGFGRTIGGSRCSI